MDKLTASLSVFDGFDYAVLALNFIMFVFAPTIVRRIRPSTDDVAIAGRAYTLRAANVILLLLYGSAIFISEFAIQLYETGITLLLAVLATHFFDTLILRRYGRTRTIDEIEYRSETYQSEVFALLTKIVVTVSVILIVINIWGMTGWLRTTSVLGALAILLFSTKDVWIPDNINGLILLYNGDVEPGSVIRVDELDLLGIVVQTTMTQTRLRDLRRRHIIVVPNAKLRNCKIEILSKASSKGIMRYADFKLSYGIDSGIVDELFEAMWRLACARDNNINEERPPAAKLENAGDHGVEWRLCYWVKNVYGMIDAAHAINRAAYEVAEKRNIGLNTPLTYRALPDRPIADRESDGR
ncbi:MAG TPA: mechanosensitive ion channel [Gammaproteobacteria bacterium]|nr:mechanosensitive ion channel [Gammaproteobacteria bacterium]